MSWHMFLSALSTGLLLAGGGLAQPAPTSSLPSDADIRSILVDRIDNQRKGVGIVVGVIDEKGRRVVAYGRRAIDDDRPVDGDTIFNVGAITKVFTGLLLADMAQRREVALTDPVMKFLPKQVTVEDRGQKVTLQDLATHTSGLPRMPANLLIEDGYTTKQLYEFLTAYTWPRETGRVSEYSNAGFGLLGTALGLRAGSSYEALVHSRIAVPLGLKSTGINLSHEMRQRLAVGHDNHLNPVTNWKFEGLAGAGGLRSSANDLLTLLAAAMGYSKSSLGAAMNAMLTVRRPSITKDLDNALGWQVFKFRGKEIVDKDGSAFSDAYSSFIGYEPKSRTGVVVLSNALTSSGVSDIGLHLLDARFPLRGNQMAAIAVNPAVLDRYIGRYQLSPTNVLTITREGEQFFAQMTGQQKREIFAQSDQNFFYKALDAQLSFEVDSPGQATALMMFYGGRISRAPRVEEQPKAAK